MANNHFTSFFKRVFKRDNTLSIKRSQPGYYFLNSECKNEFSKDANDNILLRMDIERIEKQKDELFTLKHSIRKISKSTGAYDFFIQEYRQNMPMRDCYGNIILSDDMISSKKM